MIVVHISPTKIERVLIQAESDFEESIDLLIWQLVERHVKKLDEELRKFCGFIRSGNTEAESG